MLLVGTRRCGEDTLRIICQGDSVRGVIEIGNGPPARPAAGGSTRDCGSSLPAVTAPSLAPSVFGPARSSLASIPLTFRSATRVDERAGADVTGMLRSRLPDMSRMGGAPRHGGERSIPTILN